MKKKNKGKKQLTRIPSHLDSARSGLKARRVLIALNEFMLVFPSVFP